jgi:hypothetical protein
VLEVVQHDQQAPLGQPGTEQLAGRAAGGQGHGQGLGHRDGQQVGHAVGVVRLHPGQGDDGDPVGEPRGQPLGRGQGEPGLADPARPDQGQQPARLPLDQHGHPGQVVLPADEAAGAHGAGGGRRAGGVDSRWSPMLP